MSADSAMKVNTAKDDILGLGPLRCHLGQFERVSGEIGVANDVVALVVVPENQGATPQPPLRLLNPSERLVLAETDVILQRPYFRNFQFQRFA